jgi:hypothetical protein
MPGHGAAVVGFHMSRLLGKFRVQINICYFRYPVGSLEQPTATLSRPLQDFMSDRPQGQTRSAVGFLIAAVLSLLMFAVVMAYQFTGDFTGLFKSGTSQTIRMRD